MSDDIAHATDQQILRQRAIRKRGIVCHVNTSGIRAGARDGALDGQAAYAGIENKKSLGRPATAR